MNIKMKNIAIIAAVFCALGTGAFAQNVSTSGCYSATQSPAADQFDQSGITCSLPGGGDRSENQAFVGIVLTFDKGEVHPKISAGLRRILVQGNDQVKGAEINFSTAPTDLAQSTVRVLGLTGKRDVMANIGLGLDLADNSVLVNGGVQVPYLRASVVYKPKDGAMIPQIEVNSYGRIAPAKGCDGTVVSRSQILRTLIDSNTLRAGGRDIFVNGSSIYNGTVQVVFPPLTDFPFTGDANTLAFTSDDNTCRTTPQGTVIELQANTNPS